MLASPRSPLPSNSREASHNGPPFCVKTRTWRSRRRKGRKWGAEGEEGEEGSFSSSPEKHSCPSRLGAMPVEGSSPAPGGRGCTELTRNRGSAVHWRPPSHRVTEPEKRALLCARSGALTLFLTYSFRLLQ